MKGPGNSFGSGIGNRNPETISSGLLAAVQGNGHAGWRRLVHTYGPLVYHWCRRERIQSVDAEDITQEVFRAVAFRVGDFSRNQAGSTFRGWLRTITRNKIWDFQKRERRRCAKSDEYDLENLVAAPILEGESDDPSNSDETLLLYGRVADWIRSEFRDSTWQAFFRVVIDEASAREVAEELGMSINAVYLAKSRVLRRVRDELQELERRF